ncbi:MAG: hypothetical protein H8D75_02745, partial [Rhodospirillaceae bacterium]|nr:hypothetical protein [Rhodospirillaceae bacterium]
MANSDFWAVVPVKDFKNAKSRLATVLNATERQQLSRTMVQDVLGAISAVSGLAGTVMGTPDPEAAALGTAFCAKGFFEVGKRGATGGVMFAGRFLAGGRKGGMGNSSCEVPLI